MNSLQRVPIPVGEYAASIAAHQPGVFSGLASQLGNLCLERLDSLEQFDDQSADTAGELALGGRGQDVLELAVGEAVVGDHARTLSAVAP